MPRSDSDIVEIKVMDYSYHPYFIGRARVADKEEMEKLKAYLMNKCSVLFKKESGWFD